MDLVKLIQKNYVVPEQCPTLRLEGGTVERIGTTARFSCDSDKILFGANSATCNSDGHWLYENGIPACVGKEIH